MTGRWSIKDAFALFCVALGLAGGLGLFGGDKTDKRLAQQEAMPAGFYCATPEQIGGKRPPVTQEMPGCLKRDRGDIFTLKNACPEDVIITSLDFPDKKLWLDQAELGRDDCKGWRVPVGSEVKFQCPMQACEFHGHVGEQEFLYTTYLDTSSYQ